MSEKLSPEQIRKAMLEIKTAIALVAYQEGLEIFKPLSNEQKVTIKNYKTALAALEAVGKIRKRCMEEIKYADEYWEDMDDRPRGSADMADEIMEFLR